MNTQAEDLARRIREALGEFNDPNMPVTSIVRDLAQRLSKYSTKTPADAQPVGEADALPGSNGGFTTAVFKASDVPVGTKLYAHPPPSAPVGVEGTPIRYFAYDRDDIDYNEFDTLAEAVASAQESLDYAGDDSWPPGGPSICYGVVLGEAREVEGSRRPAKPGDHPDADFIVEYELSGPAALAQQPVAVDEAMVERAARAWCADRDIKFEALTDCGKSRYLADMRTALTAALAAQHGGRDDD